MTPEIRLLPISPRQIIDKTLDLGESEVDWSSDDFPDTIGRFESLSIPEYTLLPAVIDDDDVSPTDILVPTKCLHEHGVANGVGDVGDGFGG